MDNKEIFEKVILNHYKSGKENIEFAKNKIVENLILDNGKMLYIKGEIIAREGQINDKIYFIERGKIIMTSGDIYKREYSCGYMMPGEIFGISAYAGMPNEVNFKALTNCNIIAIPVSKIKELSQISEEYTNNIINLVINMIRFTNIRQGSLIMGGCRESFVQFIAEHFYDFGRIDEDGNLLVTLDVTLMEIAQILNMTRETLSRIISEMKKEGIIENKRMFLKIYDLGKFFA